MAIPKTITDKLNEGRQYRNVADFEIREETEINSKIVEGYATTFNEPYELLSMDGYTVLEQVDPDAFAECDMSDVIMQYNHEGRVFARTNNGTLKLQADDVGLRIRADLSGTQLGQQVYEEIKGGYTNKMSFGFTIAKASELRQVQPDNNADEMWVYTIEKVGKLYDVSAVSLPQNDFTSISARALGNGVISERLTERLHEHEERVERAKKIEELKKLIESED